MKILGKHVYLLVSESKISPEKRKALAEGKAHVHGDPVRKQKPEEEKAHV